VAALGREAQTRSGMTGASRAMSRTLSLILFIVLVLGSGLVLGFLTTPGEWYGQLAKPDFNPPAWIFAPVWTVLYVMIALAGWRVWQLDRGGSSMKLWWAQLLLNLLWTPVFFGAHQIDLALVVILLLLAAILAFIATAWRRDRVAAWLFAPYPAWVALASVLNASIVALN
jgi:translocator protein